MNIQQSHNESVPDDKILVVAETDSATESWMAIGRDERDEAVAVFQELLGLVEALNLSLAGSPIDIRVQFSAAPPVRSVCSASGVPAVLRSSSPKRLPLAVGA